LLSNFSRETAAPNPSNAIFNLMSRLEALAVFPGEVEFLTTRLS